MTIDQFVQKYNLNESVQEDLYKVLNTEVLSSVEGFKEGFLINLSPASSGVLLAFIEFISFPENL